MKGKLASTFTIRLTKDEREVLTMYAKAMDKPMSHIVHEFIKENMVHMLLFVNRHEAEEEIKNDPHAADWTSDLPDAAKDRQMRLDREARERKAAQKA
jgi:predicted DNA-binding protein